MPTDLSVMTPEELPNKALQRPALRAAAERHRVGQTLDNRMDANPFILALAVLAAPMPAELEGVDDAVEALRRSESFGSWVGGHKPQPSPAHRAFASLVRGGREADLFALTLSTRAGARLYGLCGLRHLNSDLFGGARRRLSHDHAKVRITYYCTPLLVTIDKAIKLPKVRDAASIFDNVCDDLSEGVTRGLDNVELQPDGAPPGR